VNKRHSNAITIGGFDHIEAITLGGGLPVAVQTMWKDRLGFADLEGALGEATISRINRLKDMGCGLLRFAVPDLEAAEIVGNLASRISLPLVADIHFDYKIALRCLDFPIAKIRINPGNIGKREHIEKVLSKAASKGRPIRIGVNAGSFPLDLRRSVEAGALNRAEALVVAAERELAIFQEFGFSPVLLSMKASCIADTIKANRMLAERTPVPLHIGVTEAGPLIAGVVRNTVGLYTLLGEGIGDTIRVSLSDTMENEVIAGREILEAVADSTGEGAKQERVVIISCPRCGRNSFDTHAFTQRWQHILYAMRKQVTIAVMGCVVNGPEEARYADLGITGAGNKVLLFCHGKIIKTIDASEADDAFAEALEKL
jgi:(E)-4-hydroxy-3-methylbut-2-enyl-diphosphate synthase